MNKRNWIAWVYPGWYVYMHALGHWRYQHSHEAFTGWEGRWFEAVPKGWRIVSENGAYIGPVER